MSEQMTEAVAASETHNFLARLGLDNDTDARAIRRAYARLLKQIDQEAQAEVFQDLREAYEVALQWAAHQVYLKEQAEQESAPPAEQDSVPAQDVAAAPALFETDPDLLAWQAFERFVAAAATLTQGRMLRDQSLWEDAIRRELEDEQLINVTARTIFEARLVHQLAGGWQLGHDTLFAAACVVFGWQGDRRRLQQFGYAGSVLNRALDERQMFEVQPEQELGMQQKVLARLTRAGAPDSDQLQRDMFYLEQMLERFPTLMGLTVDADKVAQWRSLYQTLAAQRGKPFQVDDMPEPVLEKESGGLVKPLGIILALLVMLVFFSQLIGAGNATLKRQKQAHYTTMPTQVSPRLGQDVDYAPLLTSLERQRTSAPAKPRSVVAIQAQEGLSRAQLDEIGSRIGYKRLASAGPARLHVAYDVQLGLSGMVVGVVKTKGSGDEGFDDAVAKAIKESKPFPPATARKLKLEYRAQYRVRTRAQERSRRLEEEQEQQ